MVELPVEARPNSPGIHYRATRAALALLLSASACTSSRPSIGAPALPPFVVTVRAYGGAGHDAAQLASMQDLGLEYIHGFVGFNWDLIETQDDDWKWDWVDERMDLAAEFGLRVIPFLMIPKEDLPWLTRTDPRMPEEYGEYAYEFTRRYRGHSAWSGLVAVWGGSSDILVGDYPGLAPEVVVPLLNAAYEGIKRADPETIVIGFNMATTASSAEQWEQWRERAFALGPLFDWFGVQSHNVLVTELEDPGAYAGLMGLTNVRAFLDAHGYGDRPLFLNEGGFPSGSSTTASRPGFPVRSTRRARPSSSALPIATIHQPACGPFSRPVSGMRSPSRK